MKRIKQLLFIIIVGFVLVPIMKVNAVSECAKDIIITTDIANFECTGVNGDLKFLLGSNDYSSYFTVLSSENVENSNLKTVSLKLNKNIPFEDKTKETISLVVKDSSSSTYTIPIKNTLYNADAKVSTTTTKPVASIYTVTLDPNNGDNVTTDTCSPTESNTTCNVKLPTLNKEGFTGWGTAKTCKDGKVGTISISGDTTYYACYNTNANTANNSKILLTGLSLINEKTQENIKFGTFSKKNTTYSFKVLNDVDSIKVDAKAEEGITVEVTGNENLKEGKNEILIKLTNAAGESNTYTLNVTRLKKGEIISDMHLLKSLIVGSYNINFDKNTLIYNLTIPGDVSSLEIKAIPEEDGIEPIITGEKNVVNGSEITINLTGEDGNTTIYTIHITKEAKTNILLFSAIGVIVLLILVLVILVIFKSNKKKKNINKNASKTNSSKKNNSNDIEVFKI